MELRCRDLPVSLQRIAIMGVLNVTPDSFSDGGLWLEPDAAIEHGLQMVAEGATIIDVGGESTRPGAPEVPLEEELRRVLPVVSGLAEQTDAAISIDTRKPEVARRAVEAGASIINDTAGEASSQEMDPVAAETGAAIVIMHSRGTPATMPQLDRYTDVVAEVRDFLARRAEGLLGSGVEPDRIVLDPGIGFAKNATQNMELLDRLEDITSLEQPVLVGTSRKSFIGAALDLPEDQRVEATIATCVIAALKGARLLRVHDVQPVIRAIRMTEAIAGAGR